jgi:hypothetical protein
MAAAPPNRPAAIAGPHGDSERDFSASAVSMEALGAVESTDDGMLWCFLLSNWAFYAGFGGIV